MELTDELRLVCPKGLKAGLGEGVSFSAGRDDPLPVLFVGGEPKVDDPGASENVAESGGVFINSAFTANREFVKGESVDFDLAFAGCKGRKTGIGSASGAGENVLLWVGRKVSVDGAGDATFDGTGGGAGAASSTRFSG